MELLQHFTLIVVLQLLLHLIVLQIHYCIYAHIWFDFITYLIKKCAIYKESGEKKIFLKWKLWSNKYVDDDNDDDDKMMKER